MKPILKSLILDKYQFYETHLSLVNCILPAKFKMTPTEIIVLSRFMSFEGDIARDRFGKTARKLVKEELEISTGGLSNYMRAFRDKGILDSKGDIREIFFPNGKEQIYNFKLAIKDADVS